MTKAEKTLNNENILRVTSIAREELTRELPQSERVRLRYCTAYVYETTNYYFLRSYNTFIAFIDKNTDTCYDILRFAYGYTVTSAQHIAKFRYDYGCCNRIERYYN